MKARKTTSWWPNMVVLERVNAHFTLLETKAIVLVGFASVKIVGLASINIRQGQLFFVSFDGACGRHSSASEGPQSQTQPTQVSEKARRIFFSYLPSFLSWQFKHYSGYNKLFYKSNCTLLYYLMYLFIHTYSYIKCM